MEVQHSDSLIAIEMDKLIAIWGFPNRKRTGIPCYLIACVLHRAKKDSLFREEKVLKALQEGEITPKTYAQFIWITRQDGRVSSLLTIPKILSEEDKKLINTFRNKIGLPLIEEEEKLNRYFKNPSRNIYYFNIYRM